MEADAAIDSIRLGLRDRRWDEVEATALAACRGQDPQAAASISAVDLSAYRVRIADGLMDAMSRVSIASARAVYWEFDPDNDWKSAFFVCRSYSPEQTGDDDWAADYEQSGVIDGPSMPEMARLAGASWNRSATDGGRNAYLVARTMIAFGRAAERVWTVGLPLCAGYHDQTRVIRIFDPT